MVKRSINSNEQLITYETFSEFEKMLKQPMISERDDASESGSSSFCGTRSWKQAEEFRMFGDKESAAAINRFKSKLDNAMEKVVQEKTRNYNDVAGFQPIVPNAVMNLPISMINQKRVVKKGKVIKLHCDMGFRAGTDKDDIAYRGALILSVIDEYERQGYRIELSAGVSAMGRGDKCVGFVFPIKQAGQPLNILKVAYYIVNPSFLRRTYFRFCEVETHIDNITSGYGQQTQDSSRLTTLQNFIGGDTVVINATYMPSESDGDEKNIKKLTKLIDKQLEALKKKSEKKRTRN